MPLSPPSVPARTPIFIGIDVQADGLFITLWRGQERNAVYARVDKAKALGRALPEAIDEAIAFAQSSSGDTVTE